MATKELLLVFFPYLQFKILFFETGSHYISLTGLRFTETSLPLSPKIKDIRQDVGPFFFLFSLSQPTDSVPWNIVGMTALCM